MSKQYKDMSISDFLNLASQSSDEMGSLGGGKMVDYETGHYFDVRDEETAVFVASARNMVEELCKRLNRQANDYANLYAEVVELRKTAQALAELEDIAADLADALPSEKDSQ